jgi:hypothetical protein
MFRLRSKHSSSADKRLWRACACENVPWVNQALASPHYEMLVWKVCGTWVGGDGGHGVHLGLGDVLDGHLPYTGGNGKGKGRSLG